jgi:outer membrane protein OmpA-like peptidoglycan-associated protein
MRAGLAAAAAVVLLAAGAVEAVPSQWGLHGLRKVVSARPVGRGHYGIGLFTELGLSSDERTAALSEGATGVTDTEYDLTGYLAMGYGATDVMELGARVGYIWNGLKRDNSGSRGSFTGDWEGNQGFSELGLSAKYSFDLTGEDRYWMGLMPQLTLGLAGDPGWVEAEDEWDGIWETGQPMFRMRRPMMDAGPFSAGIDVLTSVSLDPVLLHLNGGYHYYRQKFEFHDRRYQNRQAVDSVAVDLEVEDPVFHLAGALEYPTESVDLFLEAEWRHFMKRDYEYGDGEDYDDMAQVAPGLRFKTRMGFAVNVHGSLALTSFDPEWSDLGHGAYQAGGMPTDGFRAARAPFPGGYYPDYSFGVDLIFASDLAAPPTHVWLSGTVADAETGEALAAELSFPGSATESVTADAETGFYKVRVPVGSVSVVVERDGYITIRETVSTAEAEDVARDFAMEVAGGTISGTVTGTERGEPIEGAAVAVTDTELSATTGPDGVYMIEAPAGTWTVTASAEGCVAVSKVVDVSSGETAVQDFELCPELVEGQVLSFDNIYFDVGSANIKRESYGILDNVVTALEANPDVHVRIAGHTDSDGSASYNQTLSEQRAQSVMDYLVEHGISARRLSTVGYGESRPAVPNDSPANKARNRRIEFEITSSRM